MSCASLPHLLHHFPVFTPVSVEQSARLPGYKRLERAMRQADMEMVGGAIGYSSRACLSRSAVIRRMASARSVKAVQTTARMRLLRSVC